MRHTSRVRWVLASGIVLLGLKPEAAPQSNSPQAAPVQSAVSQTTRRDDVFFLTNGDRITGKAVSSGKRLYVVQTSFGRLTIPRGQIERIRHPDGTDEVLGAAGAAEAGVPRQRARLILIVVGKLFWQAWNPKEVADPTLRLEVRLDEDLLGAYVDSRPDPEEIPRAVVNSFSFLADQVAMDPGPGTTLLPPEARPGRIALKMDIPIPTKGPHQLRLAYQVNTGTVNDPEWKDVVEASAACELRPPEPTFVRVRQDGGRMEFSGFSKRRMKFVETFRVDLTPETSDSAP